MDWVLQVDKEVTVYRLDEPEPDLADVWQLVEALGFQYSYYLNTAVAALSATLLNDIQVPHWFDTGARAINMWCGVLGTSCGLHCDLAPNCNVQIVGRKRFTLIAPDETNHLYRIKGRTHCRFDPHAPDFESFPLARRATQWECTLRPGEALYIPVGWYHQTTVTSGWAINVNMFWRRPFPHGLATPGAWPHLLRQAKALSLARLGVAA